MKYDCEVIRDLLPLYADKACSEKSREMVEEHLAECPVCCGVASELLDTALEDTLHRETESVLEYGLRQFRRRTAAVGSAVSGVFLIPVLICLAANLIYGPAVSWVAVVMAALAVLASLVVVPILVPEDKLFWTFCAFCASTVLLLGVTCIYSRGDWFRIASGGFLFGMSVVFLPFLLRARPLKRLIGQTNRLLIVLGVDVALLFNLLSAVDTRGRFTLADILFTVGAIGAIVCVGYAIFTSRRQSDGPRGK